MQSSAKTVKQYLETIPEERKEAFSKIRNIILENLPEGFQEYMNYGMIGYVVPHSIYPAGYHCDTALPLPFMGLASQKNSINMYHMGLYADEKMLEWFKNEYPKHAKRKLDMGKSCIRFKKMDDIPYELIGALTKKITVQNWIDTYESAIKK